MGRWLPSSVLSVSSCSNIFQLLPMEGLAGQYWASRPAIPLATRVPFLRRWGLWAVVCPRAMPKYGFADVVKVADAHAVFGVPVFQSCERSAPCRPCFLSKLKGERIAGTDRPYPPTEIPGAASAAQPKCQNTGQNGLVPCSDCIRPPGRPWGKISRFSRVLLVREKGRLYPRLR